MATRNVEYIIGLRDKITRKLKNINTRVRVLDSSMVRLRGTIGTLFTGFAAARVVQDIIKVGSNFEQLQISFETMLGSAEKATKLIKDLTQFAIKTPFELQDVSKGAKALLAFGIANEKIIPTLKSLGDVAAGLSVPIGRLILNFGQVRTQGKLTGRELRDFAIAGVPLLEELAKVMGKSTAQVTKLVSEGAVGFPVVEQAFANMSGEGGKFFNLMQKQTASTGGQISNLRDVVSLLENDLFLKFQPAINNVVVAIQQWTAFLRKNIDTVVDIINFTGKLIKFLIIYKALQISINFILVIGARAWKLIRLSIVLMNRGLVSSIRLLKGFRLALARTGIGLALIALTELVIVFTDLDDRVGIVRKSQERLNKAFDKADKKTSEQTEKLRVLVTMLNSKTKADFVQKRALSELQRIFPEYFKNLDIEAAKLQDIELILKKVALANRGRAIMLERTRAQEKLQEIEQISPIKKFATGIIPGAEEFRTKQLRQQRGLVAALTLKAKRVKDAITRLDIQARIDKINKDIAIPGIGDTKVGGTTIKSAAPKTFNINIEKLVGVINNNVTNMKEGMAASKRVVTEALLTALNDTQTLVK